MKAVPKWNGISSLGLLGLLMLTLCLPVGAAQIRGSLCVTLTAQGKPVSGEQLTLYQVKTGSEGGLTPSFRDWDAPMEADALARYAKEHGISGKTQSTDSAGTAYFGALEMGIYLVVQSERTQDNAVIAPFLVSIPMEIGGKEIWDVKAFPKTESVIPKPEPEDPKLPQTGQLKWPAPVLAVAGLGTAGCGWLLTHKAKRNETDGKQ